MEPDTVPTSIHFLIAGDANFFATMRECMARINRHHPDAFIHVYDWGLENHQAEALRSAVTNLSIIDWKENIAALRRQSRDLRDVPVDEVHINLAKRHNVKFEDGFRKRLVKACVKYFPRSPVSKIAIRRAIFYENLLIEKIRCMKDLSRSLGNEPMAFLDADIVLLENIDDLFENEFDVAFTMLREEDFSDQDGFCLCVNSGAVYFGADKERRDGFIDHWLRTATNYDGYLSEQAALSIILEKSGNRTLYSTVAWQADGREFNILLLPCDIFNCFYFFQAKSVEELDPVKIVHFIGNSYHNEEFSHLAKGLMARR
jgi:hypothetical protein